MRERKNRRNGQRKEKTNYNGERNDYRQHLPPIIAHNLFKSF